MKKAVPLEDAVAMIPEGTVVMVGGFMGVGSPQRLIDELVRQRRGRLTLVCNDTARPGVGIARLIDAGLVNKVIASHIGTNAVTQQACWREASRSNWCHKAPWQSGCAQEVSASAAS